MGTAGWERDTHLECPSLSQGEYYVYVELDWTENSQENEFAVTCYGSSQSAFLRDEKMLFTREMILENAYRSLALKQQNEIVTATDYAKQGQEKYKKYKAFTPEGFGFTIYKNESEGSTLKERVTFNRFKGLKLLPPFADQEHYEVTVEPGNTVTVLFWCDPEGYAMSSSTAIQIMHGDSDLKTMLLEQGKKNGRPDTETQEDYGIYQYSMQHNGGMAYFYVNGSSNQILDEEIQFTMDGLEIEGMPEGTDLVEFRLGPGEEKLIKLKAVTDGWKIGS